MATFDVLLPVRDGIDHLAKSIDSVRAQTFRDWRLLVLDHGSADGSRELAEDYAASDARIAVRSHPDARGLAGLLNLGIAAADCRFLMRHDADDVCLPDRMAMMLEAFDLRPGCVALGGQVEVIDGAGSPIGPMDLPTGADRVTAACFFRNPIAHPAATFDFAAMSALGVRYGVDFIGQAGPEVAGLAEDYYLFGQLALSGRCDNVDRRVIQYRWHGGNVAAKQHHRQILLALSIARFLVRSFCAQHGVPYFDPAPFCNLGDALFDVDGRRDFDEEFDVMASTLRKAIGRSAGLERELAFRRVVATRRTAKLLLRYARFRTAHAPDSSERSAVRGWMSGRLRGRPAVMVSAA